MSLVNMTFVSFVEQFEISNRKHNYTEEGFEQIIKYLKDCGVSKIDPVAICCSFTEYHNLSDLMRDLGITHKDIDRSWEDLNFSKLTFEQLIEYVKKKLAEEAGITTKDLKMSEDDLVEHLTLMEELNYSEELEMSIRNEVIDYIKKHGKDTVVFADADFDHYIICN